MKSCFGVCFREVLRDSWTDVDPGVAGLPPSNGSLTCSGEFRAGEGLVCLWVLLPLRGWLPLLPMLPMLALRSVVPPLEPRRDLVRNAANDPEGVVEPDEGALCCCC